MKRVLDLRRRLGQTGKYPYLVTDPSDIYYISGFTGSSAYIVLTENDNVFITDGRYELQVKSELADIWKIEIVTSYTEFLTGFLSSYNKVYGTGDLTLAIFSELSHFVSVLYDREREISSLRMIKDDREVESIRHAYEVAGAGLIQSLKQFRFGQEERMWAAILEYNMKINGARKESFDTIVASGPRGALPHGVASDKKIRADEAVIIDYGAKTGYVSDITRMVYNGNDQQVLDHLKIISDTIDIVLESIKPGKICGEIYTIGKNYLARYGLDKYFNHGLGHSLGIDVHEKPSLSPRDDTVIQEGMIFTIEPGVYFSDRYGIRIEETVLVKKNGCEILSSVLKDRCFKNI